MTLVQLQYAIACANTSSFTKAAESMFTTTSNLSKTIKAIEQEIGYDIFKRNPYGVELTPEGISFIAHANNIMNEVFSINQIEKQSQIKKFTLMFMYSPYVYYAIEKFIQDTQNSQEQVSFSFLTSSHIDCLNSLSSGQADVAITAIPIHATSQYHELLKVKGIQHKEICRLDTVITVNQNHPLAKSHRENGKIDTNLLRDYTYVMPSTFDISDFPITIPKREIESHINMRSVIRISPHSWRDTLLENTYAYAIGYRAPARYLSKHGLYAIPVSEKDVALYALTTPRYGENKNYNIAVECIRSIANEE